MLEKFALDFFMKDGPRRVIIAFKDKHKLDDFWRTLSTPVGYMTDAIVDGYCIRKCDAARDICPTSYIKGTTSQELVSLMGHHVTGPNCTLAIMDDEKLLSAVRTWASIVVLV